MTEIKQANVQAFDKGMDKFKKRLSLIINNRLVVLANQYVERAVEDWVRCKPELKKDMTGNLITGFSAGVYFNGRLIHISGATDGGINGVSGQPEYWMIGANDLTDWSERGLYKEQGGQYLFHDYDTWAEVYDVVDYDPSKPFSFQDVPERRYAIDLAVSFLHSYQNRVPKEGYYIVVCNGATYAEYLKTVRRLDVMTSLEKELSNGEFKKEIKNLLKQIKHE